MVVQSECNINRCNTGAMHYQQLPSVFVTFSWLLCILYFCQLPGAWSIIDEEVGYKELLAIGNLTLVHLALLLKLQTIQKRTFFDSVIVLQVINSQSKDVTPESMLSVANNTSLTISLSLQSYLKSLLAARSLIIRSSL